MTRLLLLGLVPQGTSFLPCPEPHLHLPAGEWAALALPLKADSPADGRTSNHANGTTDRNTGGHADGHTERQTAAPPCGHTERHADGQTDEAARMLDWATRQNAVLAAYIPLADVVPVALGAVFSGADALRDHLERQADILARAAQAVAGRCEYVLQIRADDDTPTSPAPLPASPVTSDGGGFLRQRLARRDTRLHRTQDRQRFIQQVGARITSLVSQASPRDVAGKALLADLSLLVPRGAQADLIATLSALSEQSSALGLALRLIGPSPAYSFVIAAGAEDHAKEPGGAHV